MGVSDLRPKVIYVMGAGRSGSTVLGVVLGNCSDVFYAGELDAWLRKGGISHFEGGEREAFWHQVRQEVATGAELFGEQAWRSFEHSSAAFKPAAWRVRRKLRGRYRQAAQDLYSAVARVSGAPCIVDTSHYPLRAREMRALSGIDLHLVYLVRRPENVVASFSRQDVDQPTLSPLAANIYLYITHVLATLVFLRHRRDRRILVKYEEFASDPQRLISRLLAWAGVSQSAPDMGALGTGVAFQGNRLLRMDSVAFQADEWRPTRERRMTMIAQLPWTLLLQRLGPSLRAPKASREGERGCVSSGGRLGDAE